MFPLYDDNPTELFPYVTIALIAACVWVWWTVQGAGFSEPLLNGSVCALGAIPAEITGMTTPQELARAPCPLGGLTVEGLFTSMFLHGSWMHLIGNMWFLWIFGNNVEDSMGHLRFVVFYVLCGVVAAMVHVMAAPTSTTPLVGASGAISGVMGAYLILYPHARVDTLFFFFFFVRIVPLPAWLMLGYWMLIQVMAQSVTPVGGGGVAYLAHIGGFVAGMALIFLFRRPELVDAKRRGVVLPPSEVGNGGWW